MNRRDFLKSLPPYLAAAYASSGLFPLIAKADPAPAISNPILVNIILDGGPDLRHLLPPAYNNDPNSYGYTFWANRYTSQGVGNNPSEWASRWSQGYDSITSGGVNFGILRRAGWLRQQWDAGNVAIINNVYASSTRDHDHAGLVYRTGNMEAPKGDLSRPGWGGRIAHHLSAKVISASRNVNQFCFVPDLSNPQSHTVDRIVAINDSRHMGLFESEAKLTNPGSTDPRAVIDRALSAYFASKSVSDASKYKVFATHQSVLKSFGASIDERLGSYPIPTAISNLYTGGATGRLNSTYFGQQVRNLYDSLLCQDLLTMRVASMVYGGWDTHRNQMPEIENNLSDLFGTTGGLATLSTALASNLPSALDNIVYVIGGEFGRQLASNGGGGTDHGRGMTVLVIGNRVNGGIYGGMFPSTELADSENGYLRANSDILARTSVEHVFASVCNHMQTGLGATVFPDVGDGIIETSGMFNTLFSNG